MAKSAKKAFKKSEERYHVLFETMRDGVMYVDLGGHIIECNQAYADMLGYSRDELKGMTYQELTPEEWHEMEDEIVKEEMMKNGYSDLYEKELFRKDGTVFPVNIRVWLIRDEDGQVVGMGRIIRDITLRKSGEQELRRSEERYRKLFELSPDAILTFDLAGLCT
jgi:PAS domain S-box-containing protein